MTVWSQVLGLPGLCSVQLLDQLSSFMNTHTTTAYTTIRWSKCNWKSLKVTKFEKLFYYKLQTGIIKRGPNPKEFNGMKSDLSLCAKLTIPLQKVEGVGQYHILLSLNAPSQKQARKSWVFLDVRHQIWCILSRIIFR